MSTRVENYEVKKSRLFKALILRQPYPPAIPDP